MIKEAIAKVVDKQDLTYDEAYKVIAEIMAGETTPTQNAAFLSALSTKSTKAETIDEITGCAAAMRDAATKFEHNMDLLEIVGTGGDNAHSFNISTTSAFVIAASGIKVSKHGNRAASSLSGTADCLEALGANIDLDPEKCRKLLDSVGFCFFFTGPASDCIFSNFLASTLSGSTFKAINRSSRDSSTVPETTPVPRCSGTIRRTSVSTERYAARSAVLSTT